MSKLALFFIFLVSMTFAFDRPWNNASWVATNPNIFSYGVEIWWNLPELHKTIYGIDFSGIETNQHTELASSAKFAADNNYVLCTQRQNLSTLWVGAIPVMGQMIILMGEFSRVSNCMQYRSNWILSVDSALNAAEESFRQSEQSISNARKGHDDLVFLGLCNKSYYYEGGEHCVEMEVALEAIDNNISDGTYGHHALALDYSRSLEQDLQFYAPDISATRTIVQLNHIVARTYESLAEKAKTSRSNAEAELASSYDAATAKQSTLNQNLGDIEKEKLYLIKKSPYSIQVQNPGTVNELLETLKKEKLKTDNALENVRQEKQRIYKQSYLANSITSLVTINEKYADLTGESRRILELARETVIQQRTEAQREIEKSALENLSPDSLELLDQSIEFFELGEVQKTLGDQFFSYSKSAEFARLAKNQKTLAGQQMTENLFAELEFLISNAEKDEINIVSEKETLKFLKSMKSKEVEIHIQSAISSILSKAKTKYETDILESSKRIRGKITLAGHAAADLFTDIDNCEKGIVINGQINYPDAIGRLKQLKEKYNYLEQELEFHLSDIVSNSMIARATPMYSYILLDEITEITLDVVATNSREFGARNVSVRIPTDISFLYSDLQAGAVNTVYYDGKNLVLVFDSIQPFETKRLIFAKKMVIARTLSMKTESRGVGNGAVRTSEVLEFELEFSIPHLQLSQDLSHPLIDGRNPDRDLEKGRHVLTAEKTTEDGYLESIKNIRNYQIGVNSKVEYDIEIVPKLNINSLVVFINAINDSRISTVSAYVATGGYLESFARVSETQFAMNITDLKNNTPAIIKVSYNVENTESYVMDQIAAFELLNLSSEAENYLNQAKIQASAGNHSRSLELIETMKVVLDKEKKETVKSEEKFNGLNSQLLSEIAELSSALQTVRANSSFIDKLVARQTELERISEGLDNLTLLQKLECLGKIDFKWPSKELASLKKTAYKEYNDLKERFYKAGNSSNPSEFLLFEDSFHQLEAAPCLEYGVRIVNSLSDVQKIVELQEQQKQEEQQSLRTIFENIAAETNLLLEEYLKQASAAKGTAYSSIFVLSEKKVSSLIKDAEDSLKKDTRLFWNNANELNNTKKQMQATLKDIEDESSAKLSFIESLYRESKKNEKIQEKIALAVKMHQSGDYVNSLRASAKIAEELEKEGSNDSSPLLILGITALAVLAVIAVFIVKQQKPKKELRKLNKITEL
ncbi:hypothetical protein JXA56_03515 [Candidatus Micrarchaeota archaeon]|nr:hypothetical protein [Candidatus Micrarchaeota archaeon]